MNIAVVISDMSIPAREGLHEQLLESLRVLKSIGEVEVLVFTRDRMVTKESIQKEVAGIRVSSVHYFRVPTLVAATLRRGRFGGKIRAFLMRSESDIVVLDGALACAAGAHQLRTPGLLNWVDPGSLRFRRMARWESNFARALFYRAASIIYSSLERSAAGVPGTVWTYVSFEDAAKMRSLYPAQPVVNVPVVRRPPETGFEPQMDRSPASSKATEDFGRVSIVVYIDARTRHGKDALNRLFRSMDLHADACRYSVSVLGRVDRVPPRVHEPSRFPVQWVGWAENVEGLLRSADVVILPDTVGTGIKNRAVQAFASGATIIATGIALEGIPIDPGLAESIRVDAQFDELAERIDQAVERAGTGEVGGRGVERVLDHFGVAAVTARWQEALSLVR